MIPNFKIFLLILAFSMVCISQVEAIECTAYADCRYQGAPLRNADGSPHRDSKVVSTFKNCIYAHQQELTQQPVQAMH